MKTFVQTISALDASVRARIRARLPPAIFTDIEQAVPTVWLPIDFNVALTDATSVELGPASTRTFFRNLISSEYESDTFKGFVAGVGRLLGLTPSIYVKMTPRGWQLVFKGCGELRVVERERWRARLEYTDIPAICMQNELWIESVRDSFYSAFDLTGTPGEILWDELDFSKRRAVFLFTWK